MRLLTCVFMLSALGSVPQLAGQTAADSAAIRAAALDYIEGWFTGDAERMARALHPELVKRIVVSDEVTGVEWIDGMGMSKLVEGTRRQFGTQVPSEERRTAVTILDVMGRAASVKVDAGQWVDFMHLVKANGAWKILNVLWEMR